MTVCVVASFMYDLVATAARRPEPGETLIGTDFSTYVGGKGFNQAVAAARAGVPTAVVGRVGTDVFGAEFREFLAAEGVDATHLASDPVHGTGVGLPVVDATGQNSIIVVPRANDAVTVDDIEAARATIEAARVLLLQLELPMAATVHAARVAHDAGVPVLLNPAPHAVLPDELVSHVDLIVPNEGELRALAGAAPHAGVEQAARTLQARWGTTVIVTLGERGVLVLAPQGDAVTLPGHAVDAVDTIGAGDTFCGHLGAQLALGADLTTAARRANAAAAIAVTRRGGAPAAPHAGEVTDFLAATQPAPIP